MLLSKAGAPSPAVRWGSVDSDDRQKGKNTLHKACGSSVSIDSIV